MPSKKSYQILWVWMNSRCNFENGQKGLLLNERRKAIGLEIGTAGKLPHMAFLGNPGAGKTMVARILGRLLHGVGILQTDNVKEVQWTDLVGEYIGHTGYKTREMVHHFAFYIICST
ncbi:uncharacterized protein LOC116146361 [Pistacia vera]|uniref:uncharacterized protein LOC116146361 n=1 Tax=Pistacia vera TaxID=55513 RepID=UPI00126358C9|nr:uncharacterized protein LOC116146361 [Pistacia vera]